MTKCDKLLMLITKEKTTAEAKNKIYKTMKRFSFLFIYVPWIILAIFLICFLYDLGPLQRLHVGVVNISGIVNEFVATQAKSGLSKEDLKKNVQVFGTSLEKVMHDISLKKHIVLMPAEAVIAGAKDYTQEVLQALPVLPASKTLPSATSQDAQQSPTSQSTELMAEQLRQKMQQLEQQLSDQEKSRPIQEQPANSDTQQQPLFLGAQPGLQETQGSNNQKN